MSDAMEDGEAAGGGEAAGSADTPPQPRRRGRPRKETATETAASAPAADGSTIETAEAAPRNRGGRPRKIDPAQSFAVQAAGLHAFLAAMFSAPFMALSDQEAAMMGRSMAAVAEEFGWENGGRIGAVIGLMATAAMVEAPRLMMLRQHIANRKAMYQASQAAQAAQQGGEGTGSDA